MTRRWYTELEQDSYGTTIRVDRSIVKVTTEYQTLEIFENDELGRVMVLDGWIMLTEKDEFTYHEMLAHPALFAHPRPERVLIVGGGDGGTLREVTRHPEVRDAVLCEIDGAVIEYSTRYLPFVACGFDSPKATVHVGDGIGYIRDHPDAFDVIIVDSTDPEGFAEGLFRAPFYGDCRKALRPGGVFVQQSESPFFDPDSWARIYRELRASFTGVFPYSAAVPMYLSGFWTFAFASDDRDPWSGFEEERVARMQELRYYTADMQTHAFSLPRFARDRLA